MSKRQWLKREDWERFDELFWEVEGTSYYDVRQLAIDIIGMVNAEIHQVAIESKDNICTLLQVIALALRNVTIITKEPEK